METTVSKRWVEDTGCFSPRPYQNTEIEVEGPPVVRYSGKFAPKKRPSLRRVKLMVLDLLVIHYPERYLGYEYVGDLPNTSDIFLPHGDIEGPGVYLLGDFYIGRSYNIEERVGQHRSSVINQNNDSVGFGAREYYERFGNVPIPVRKLSDYPDDEGAIFAMFRDANFPLWNKLTPTLIECE